MNGLKILRVAVINLDDSVPASGSQQERCLRFALEEVQSVDVQLVVFLIVNDCHFDQRKNVEGSLTVSKSEQFSVFRAFQTLDLNF